MCYCTHIGLQLIIAGCSVIVHTEYIVGLQLIIAGCSRLYLLHSS